jgi:hypothetical protein
MKFRLLPLAILTFLAAFFGTAYAAEATVDPNAGSLDIAKSIYEAFTGHHYAYAGALGLMLGIALVKRYLGPKISWLHSDVGGTSLALGGAFATALVAALAGGGSVTLDMLKTSLLVGIGAAGGYAVLKKLIVEPLLKPLAAKAPAWAQPIFSLIFWIFDKPDPIADAAKAGDAAVTANPGAGATGVLGKAEEVK